MSSAYNAGSIFGDFFQIPFAAAGLHQAESDRAYQRQQDNLNRQMQYDFAQNSIKWRTEDAKRSGIHPLYALGVSPSSAQPVYSSANSEGIQSALSEMGRSFGQALSSLQLENLAAETEKTKAETKAIESQGFDFNDTSSPGSPSSQKKTSSQINSSFIQNEKDRKEVLKEAAADSKITTGAYDTLSKLNRGDIGINQGVDYLLTVTSGFSHTANKGDTVTARGLKNLGESALRGLKKVADRVGESTVLRSKLGNKKYYQYRKIADEIDKQLNSWDWTR